MTKYKKKPEKMSPREKALERLKMEIAEELGLDGKVREKGWENLTAREAGKIGGIMSRRLRDEKTKA
ncbi:MAG: alpha/beta-type small acid-soluble spore protein [Firmicutes bacterium]|nr:alpha/beta-type small acid-soluble spore protein [Bacillota bacterium]